MLIQRDGKGSFIDSAEIQLRYQPDSIRLRDIRNSTRTCHVTTLFGINSAIAVYMPSQGINEK